MNLILRDIDSHIVDKIDNLAKQKKISRNEFLKQKVDEFAFEKEANELEYNYQKLQKEIIENISYDQCAKYIRNKISSTHCTLETDLAVQSKCQDQAEYIRYDSCHDGQLKGKQIGTANTAVCKKILIVSKSYPVIASIAFKVRKAVDHTLDQRQCVKAEK